MITLNEYEDFVVKSTSGCSTQTPYCALALAGEAGEYANLVKKWIRDYPGGGLCPPTDVHRREALLELGDVLWYVAVAADSLGSSLREVAVMNEEKLRERQEGTG